MNTPLPIRTSLYMAQRRRQWQQLGLVIGGLLALFVSGQTSGLMRSHLWSLDPTSLFSTRQAVVLIANTSPAQTAASQKFEYQLNRLITQNPQDVPLRVAAAKTAAQLRSGFTTDTEKREGEEFFALYRVVESTGNEAMPCAAILRPAIQDLVPFTRTDWLETPSPSLNANNSPIPTTVKPEIASAFEQIASLGEQRDPQNAFFPMAKVYLYLAQKRDKEAFAALDRAARLAKWEDYEQDEKAADIHLGEKLYGSLDRAYRLRIAAGTSPWYLGLAASQETLTRMAEHYEAQGDKESGKALRERLQRIGNLIVLQARTTQVRDMGTQIATLAGTPGIWEKGFNLPAHRTADPESYIVSLFAATLKNVLFLAVAVCCLLIGGVVSITGYQQRFSAAAPKPVDALAKKGMAFGLLLALLLLGSYIATYFSPTFRLGRLTLPDAAFLVFTVSLLCLRLRAAPGFLRIVGKTLVVSLLIGGVLFATSVRIFSIGQVVYHAFTLGGVEFALGIFACSLVLMIPVLLWMLWATFTGRPQRLPASVGMVRNLQRTAVPVVTFLLLGYLVSLFPTVQAEIKAEGLARQMLANERAITEGRVYSDLAEPRK